MFGDDGHDVFHVLLASQEDWASLVELLGNQIQDWFPAEHYIREVILIIIIMFLLSVSGQTPGLLHDVTHRHTLVQDPELPIGRLGSGRVHEDPAVLRSQEVRNYYFFIRREGLTFRVLCTSATMEPMYLPPYALPCTN